MTIVTSGQPRHTKPTVGRRKVGRASAQGETIRDLLESYGGFRSAQSVFAGLRERGYGIGLSTVYRHLQGFVDEGVADVIHTADGEATYRYCGDPRESKHHHHLVCRRCGQAEEIRGRAVERWAEEVSRTHGYVDVEHTVEVFGVCPDCSGGRGG